MLSDEINNDLMGGIYLGVGSNMGDRFHSILTAKNFLSLSPKIKILNLSPIYETSPYGVENQSTFLNAVIEISSSLSAFELLDTIKEIEKKIGRTEGFRWGPRIIDIDILIFRDEVINEPNLTIPHLEINKRLFVIAPLYFMKPNLTIKTLSKNVEELYIDLKSSNQKVELYPLKDDEKKLWENLITLV
jgi:2-amino-4-hydroxy-6-hydroxymethyldihydropteridine diphosphokinase